MQVSKLKPGSRKVKNKVVDKVKIRKSKRLLKKNNELEISTELSSLSLSDPESPAPAGKKIGKIPKRNSKITQFPGFEVRNSTSKKSSSSKKASLEKLNKLISSNQNLASKVVSDFEQLRKQMADNGENPDPFNGNLGGGAPGGAPGGDQGGAPGGDQVGAPAGGGMGGGQNNLNIQELLAGMSAMMDQKLAASKQSSEAQFNQLANTIARNSRATEQRFAALQEQHQNNFQPQPRQRIGNVFNQQNDLRNFNNQQQQQNLPQQNPPQFVVLSPDQLMNFGGGQNSSTVSSKKSPNLCVEDILRNLKDNAISQNDDYAACQLMFLLQLVEKSHLTFADKSTTFYNKFNTATSGLESVLNSLENAQNPLTVSLIEVKDLVRDLPSAKTSEPFRQAGTGSYSKTGQNDEFNGLCREYNEKGQCSRTRCKYAHACKLCRDAGLGSRVKHAMVHCTSQRSSAKTDNDSRGPGSVPPNGEYLAQLLRHFGQPNKQ